MIEQETIECHFLFRIVVQWTHVLLSFFIADNPQRYPLLASLSNLPLHGKDRFDRRTNALASVQRQQRIHAHHSKGVPLPFCRFSRRPNLPRSRSTICPMVT